LALKRGEIWTVAGGSAYTGKSRPVVIIQADIIDATESITVCGFTRTKVDAPLFRISASPSPANGLEFVSFVMIDKINAIRPEKLGYRIGRVGNKDMAQIDRAIALFLGLAEQRVQS
jgi:mRNA interferase MazF